MRIKDYTLESPISADDRLLGTVNATNATKNFRIGDIANSLINDQTLQEVLDNNHDLVDGNNFQGTNAGVDNTGENVNAFGQNAADSNTQDNINAFGQSAAAGNSGTSVNAFGRNAALDNEGNIVNAFGPESAKLNTGDYVNSMGNNSCYDNAGDYVNAFGRSAANGNQGNHVNAFGVDAGLNNQLSNKTIFSNASLPSYVNAAAAAVAITVLNGASANCTYLYYDASTATIKAIRL
jgi:hypothetical protein